MLLVAVDTFDKLDHRAAVLLSVFFLPLVYYSWCVVGLFDVPVIVDSSPFGLTPFYGSFCPFPPSHTLIPIRFLLPCRAASELPARRCPPPHTRGRGTHPKHPRRDAKI